MKRWVLLSLLCVATSAHADPGPENLSWAAFLGGGFHGLFSHEDNQIAQQLQAANHPINDLGPFMTGGAQHYVLDWLIVGGALDARWQDGRESSRLSQPLEPPPDLLHLQVTGRAFVQPTLCLEDTTSSCVIYGGFQLGLGFGPSMLFYRDSVDLGTHVRGEAALVWTINIIRFFMSLRVVNALVWQSNLGPSNLGFGVMWVPTVDATMGWRW